MSKKGSFVLVALWCIAAQAQRADDNVTAQSDDAFGRSVGTESIGIYNVGDVRGFSPIQAGNVRIEGLYFDRQTDPTSRLVEGSAIRVGIAAQSYPFPSPTGIVDYNLRRVGEERLVSAVMRYGPYDSLSAEVDAQIPLARERFGITVGAGVHREAFHWGGRNEAVTFAIAPLWKPTGNMELQPFYSRTDFSAEEPQPFMLTADGALPPRIRRARYFGQPWGEIEGVTSNYGVLGRARRGAWTARLGLFESVFAPSVEFAELFVDIDAQGFANETVVAFPDSRYASRSGELRLSRLFEAGNRRHTLHLAARGRNQTRRYGGEVEIDVGRVQLGIVSPVPRPEFAFGPQSRDEVTQETGGVAYELQWKEVGELSVGVQKTFYSKAESEAEPTLVNGTATVYATPRIAVYGSYTEGLEESPVAPANALNRNVAAPALLTEQYDLGVRWNVLADLKLIAGLFHVEKPHFDVDAAGVFRELGTVEHRGVELSLTGAPLPNLTMVAGARFLDATVAGPVVESGLIGAKPVGAARRYALASFDYALPGTGLSLDATVENISTQVANTDNTREVPGRSVLHLGGRYRFTLFAKPATLRAQVHNVFDKYGWTAVAGGAYVYNAPRRFTMYVAADL